VKEEDRGEMASIIELKMLTLVHCACLLWSHWPLKCV